MAERRSNTAVVRQLRVSDAAVAKHINSILAKLELPTATDDHRSVLAVLSYLHANRAGSPPWASSLAYAPSILISTADSIRPGPVSVS